MDNEQLVQIKTILKKGGVVVFETDTVWGLGCLPSCESAVKKIYDIKGRDTSKPLILMSSNIRNLLPYIKSFPQKAVELANRYFPGALTLVLEKSEKTPGFITSEQNTVGIRVPNHPQFAAICEVLDGKVLATTSANRSELPACLSYGEVLLELGGDVDFVVKPDGGSICGAASTVVSVLGNETKVLRDGDINIET